MNFLEEESEKELHSVEDAPNYKYRYAETGEDSILPERWRDDALAVETFLSMAVVYEGSEKGERDAK